MSTDSGMGRRKGANEETRFYFDGKIQ
jgi:hypothetical protein